MISLQNENIQAVLFHDRTSDAACAALKVFLQRILQRFAEVFEHELEQLQPQLQASATPTADEVRRLYVLVSNGNIPVVLTNLVISRRVICSARQWKLRSGDLRRNSTTSCCKPMVTSACNELAIWL